MNLGRMQERNESQMPRYTLLSNGLDDDVDVSPTYYRFPIQKKKLLYAAVAAVVVVAIVVGVVFTVRKSQDNAKSEGRRLGAAVANGLECSDIAKRILGEGGSVADAAIATLLCEGITCPQSTGIGGGFFLTIYIKEKGIVETLNARDFAPLAAQRDMFVNSTVTGGKAVAVPAELKGYWELHKKYGKLPWKALFQPNIDLCRKGHVVSGYLERILKRNQQIVLSTSLASVYVNPQTNKVYVAGDIIKRPKLADTLELIANEGASTLYNNGTLAQALVKDIQEEGGIITVEDFMRHEVRWEKPLTTKVVNNRTLYTMPAPGSGPLIVFMMNVLNNFLPKGKSIESFSRIAEVLKYAYARRSQLADPTYVSDVNELVKNLTSIQFAEEIRNRIHDDSTSQDYKYYGANFDLVPDHGTANINIIGPNGDAVVATGSINNIFGSKIISKSTGIILNDCMDDFSVPGQVNAYGLPASPANFIQPGKIPLSSMAPTMILNDNGDVDLLIGAAGGSKITSSIAYIISRYLYFNETIEEALTAPRIHHQLIPMRIEYEAGLASDVIEGLRKIGHHVFEGPYDSGFSSVTAISCNPNQYVPIFDPRRSGSKSVF